MLKGIVRTTVQQLVGALGLALKARLYASDLNRLATLYSTDKWNSHFYTPHYRKHFGHMRRKSMNILEIGVGGGKNLRMGGASLRMWKAFFPNSLIHAIDIHDKSHLQEDRIRIYQGSQFDGDFLIGIYNKIGSLDIVIDDGSHVNEHVIFTFLVLFPLLSENGIYVIEDIQTSYWKPFGGDSTDLRNPATSMNFFKALTDCLNCAEIHRIDYEPTLFDRTIVAIHFYHNLIFIQKGRNDEGSNKPHMVR
jgi:hypothetical protein